MKQFIFLALTLACTSSFADSNADAIDAEINKTIDMCTENFVEFPDLLIESIHDAQKTLKTGATYKVYLAYGWLRPVRGYDMTNSSECVGFIDGALDIAKTSPTGSIQELRIENCIAKFSLDSFKAPSNEESLNEMLRQIRTNDIPVKRLAVSSNGMRAEADIVVIEEERKLCTGLLKGAIFSSNINNFVIPTMSDLLGN